jgi:hypothetical protein
MPFQSTLNLDSGLFSQNKRQAAGGRAVRKTARSFVRELQNKMENSPHTGSVVTKARGAGFRVRHQQSSRGQRPAPFTRKLLNSIRARRLSESESIVEIGAEYAEKLQNELGRVIVSRQDEREAQSDLDRNLESELIQLL